LPERTPRPQWGTEKVHENTKKRFNKGDEEEELALQERLREALGRNRITVETEAELEDAIRRLAKLSREHLNALRTKQE
jgi:hypothetical protein